MLCVSLTDCGVVVGVVVIVDGGGRAIADQFSYAFPFSSLSNSFDFRLGINSSWKVSHRLRREISRRMYSKSCLEACCGRRYYHICKNKYFCKGSFGVTTVVGNSSENYMEWCSKNTKLFDAGACHKDIVIIHNYESMRS